MAPPFREVEFDIMYGEGISHEGDLVDMGSECGVVEKSGAWFAYEGERIGQGRENAKQFLREHADIAKKIEARSSPTTASNVIRVKAEPQPRPVPPCPSPAA